MHLEKRDKKVRKLYSITDTETNMLDYCKTCFHVEFCVQDAKQFTELTDCQSRDLDKLYFHFNTTLTSGNLAKTEAFEKGVVFSMATVKVLFHNIFLM